MSSEKITPVIIIPGFGQSKAALFDDKGNMERQVWPLNFDMKKLAKQIIGPYIKTVICRKDLGFTDTAYSMFCEGLEPFACNTDGNRRHNLLPLENRLPLSQMTPKFRGYVHKLVPIDGLERKIGDENIYFFAYNAFSSPLETAEQLHGFVEEVKSQCNTDRVNMLSFSMGGSVLTAYFGLYGNENSIKKVFLLNCALKGSVLQVDIMENNVDRKQGYSFLGFISNGDVVKSFKQALAFTTWDTRYRLLYRSLDAVRDTVFLNSPGMWALMSAEEYPRLAEKYISDAGHKELKDKTDKFYQIQQDVENILKQQKEKGVDFAICAGYGLHIMPVSASQNVSTDGMLPVSSTALCSPVVYGDEPDRSTLLFPESTHLFNNFSHSGGVKDERVQQLVADFLS